ncbi:hypothetical protein Aperf_G00000057632 [Anoplocephala perfoliata]
MFFSDGIRRIDYVIAFKLPSPTIEEELRICLLNFVQHGVDIEIEDSSGGAPVEFNEETSPHQFRKNELIFAKLHVKWNTLLQIAEILHFQKSIDIGNEVIYDSFAVSRRSASKGFSDDATDFFTPEERILAAEYIISESSSRDVHDNDPNSSKKTALLPKAVSIKELEAKGVILALFPLHENPPLSIVKEICSKNSTQFILCPTCEGKHCRFRKLRKSCADLKSTYYFDNPVSVFIAFIAPVFGMICLRLWTYQQSKLEYQWHMQNYKSTDEPSRWQYRKRVKQMNHGISKKVGLPFWTYRVPVLVFTVSATIILISLSIALEVISDVISSQLEDRLSRSDNNFTGENAPFIALGISHVFNAICVCILSAVYKWWIRWSTTIECQRTEEQHERSFLMKSSFMELINMYLSIFTGIIVRGMNYGYPGQSSSVLESPEWPVWSGLFGIFYEVYIKCTVIVFIKSAKEWIPWDRVKEVIKPIICGHHSTPRLTKETSSVNASESYKCCLANYNMTQPEDYPLFHRQFDLCE